VASAVPAGGLAASGSYSAACECDPRREPGVGWRLRLGSEPPSDGSDSTRRESCELSGVRHSADENCRTSELRRARKLPENFCSIGGGGGSTAGRPSEAALEAPGGLAPPLKERRDTTSPLRCEWGGVMGRCE